MWGTILALNDQLADWLKANLGADGISVPQDLECWCIHELCIRLHVK